MRSLASRAVGYRAWRINGTGGLLPVRVSATPWPTDGPAVAGHAFGDRPADMAAQRDTPIGLHAWRTLGEAVDYTHRAVAPYGPWLGVAIGAVAMTGLVWPDERAIRAERMRPLALLDPADLGATGAGDALSRQRVWRAADRYGILVLPADLLTGYAEMCGTAIPRADAA